MKLQNIINTLLIAGMATAGEVSPNNGVEGTVTCDGNTITYEIDGNVGSYTLPDSVSLYPYDVWQNFDAGKEILLIANDFMSERDIEKDDCMVMAEDGTKYALLWRDNSLMPPQKLADYFIFLEELEQICH